MKVTKEEWLFWRDHPITKGLLADICEVAENAAAEVMNRQEPNQTKDQYLKGFVAGISEVAGWQPQLVEEDKEENDGSGTVQSTY